MNEKGKEEIIYQLAKLEKLGWENPKAVESVFPYVLVEAINLLKNSKLIENPIDYTKTGEEANKMIDDIINKGL